MSGIVMFIHGAWLTPRVWERFAQRFAACGYTCLAPSWPSLEDIPAQRLREAPPAALGNLGVGRILAHYQALIEALPHPPLLVGHCYGGLFVQVLLDRGLGSAGIAIAPASPRGVLPGLAALVRLLPLLTRAWRIVPLSEAQFARHAAQTLDAAERHREYQRQVAPAPGRLLLEAALGIGTRIDFGNDRRAPLLLIAGENDRTIHASTVAAVFRRHRRSVAVSTYRCFPGRSHWLIAEAGWQEVADYALEWAQSQADCF
ncbi:MULTISPECIES: alpha/beta hydrolase [Pseudomonas]|uniref:alpha/beta hydrolase n=1 Tax=Pseudomonas TaxID=286 RepID=UPI00257A805E|nr:MULTISPECIES: alpha/beta hydrolase [Pseudomonas]